MDIWCSQRQPKLEQLVLLQSTSVLSPTLVNYRRSVLFTFIFVFHVQTSACWAWPSMHEPLIYFLSSNVHFYAGFCPTFSLPFYGQCLRRTVKRMVSLYLVSNSRLLPQHPWSNLILPWVLHQICSPFALRFQYVIALHNIDRPHLDPDSCALSSHWISVWKFTIPSGPRDFNITEGSAVPATQSFFEYDFSRYR